MKPTLTDLRNMHPEEAYAFAREMKYRRQRQEDAKKQHRKATEQEMTDKEPKEKLFKDLMKARITERVERQIAAREALLDKSRLRKTAEKLEKEKHTEVTVLKEHILQLAQEKWQCGEPTFAREEDGWVIRAGDGKQGELWAKTLAHMYIHLASFSEEKPEEKPVGKPVVTYLKDQYGEDHALETGLRVQNKATGAWGYVTEVLPAEDNEVEIALGGDTIKRITATRHVWSIAVLKVFLEPLEPRPEPVPVPRYTPWSSLLLLSAFSGAAALLIAMFVVGVCAGPTTVNLGRFLLFLGSK